MQEFEKHEKLKQHILRMASTGSVGSPSYWSDFISDLNDALSSIERAVLAKAMPIPKQEPFGYVVIGQGISFYRTTKEKAEYQANCLEWRDDKDTVIHPVYIQPQPAQAAANPLVDAVFSASHKKATDTHGKCPHCSHECAQAAAIPDKIKPATRTLESIGYANGWNDCIDLMLSAKPE